MYVGFPLIWGQIWSEKPANLWPVFDLKMAYVNMFWSGIGQCSLIRAWFYLFAGVFAG